MSGFDMKSATYQVESRQVKRTDSGSGAARNKTVPGFVRVGERPRLMTKKRKVLFAEGSA